MIYWVGVQRQILPDWTDDREPVLRLERDGHAGVAFREPRVVAALRGRRSRRLAGRRERDRAECDFHRLRGKNECKGVQQRRRGGKTRREDGIKHTRSSKVTSWYFRIARAASSGLSKTTCGVCACSEKRRGRDEVMGVCWYFCDRERARLALAGNGDCRRVEPTEEFLKRH